ncbi:MerR family transcriptional regulator [Erysipelothrix urinaevulpis]|uniref:MerR family transcriptional regulator n=1 Tax=Erysipelothrix urinaevulpis TaxID=2683717 RepID=UPI001356F2D9|nr:MerR family transcriptional regulator [Erysipelothrix urinaevulpis]
MKIQEVSRYTGLSDKTIRYYESQGLIHVDRDDNHYRNYSHDNVRELNMIRLMRYFSFSLNEIKDVIENPSQWIVMVQQIETMLKQEKQMNDKKEILLDVIKGKDYAEVAEESFELLEELDDFLDEEFFEEIEYLKSPSLLYTILITLLYSGPVMGLFFNAFGLMDFLDLRVVVPFALLSTVGITLTWSTYFKNRNKDLKRSNTLISFLLIILSLALLFLTLFAMTFLQERLFTNSESYIFVMNSKLLGYVFLVSVIGEIMVLFFGLRKRLTGDKDFEIFEDLLGLMKKYRAIFVVVNALLFYTFLTSVTILKNDGSLVRFGPLNPKGTAYNVNEINEIVVGYNKGFFKQYKNDFSMVLHTDDFRLDIVEANTLEEAPTYSELERLDTIYRKHQIKKTVENNNKKYCTYDKQYCDLFERIIKGESR